MTLQITLQALAKLLGGNVCDGYVSAPGPSHAPDDRSMSVRLAPNKPDGFLAKSFTGDSWSQMRDHILQRLGHDARRRVPDRSKDRSALAIELWNGAQDPGPLVRRYLHRRGLELPADVAGRVIRFHSRCPWRDADGAFVPRTVMLTAFRLIADDRLIAVHRTLLAPDGTMLDRRMLGPVRDAAMKIDRDEDVEQGLTIGEGFETCLAGRMLGFRPVWALGSAGALGAFPVLSGIDALTILAETDDSGANARAMQACGRNWVIAGREVLKITPQLVGDLNDVVMP